MFSRILAQGESGRRALGQLMVSYDVFLSYARADSARARIVCDKLEAKGLSVFFDAEGIDGGEEFPIVIDRAVKSARCVLGLWSRAALERRWVRIESRIGLDQKKLVAAMLDSTRPEELPAEFYNVNFESLATFAGQDDHEGWRRVLRAIGKRIGRADLTREDAPAANASAQTTTAPAQASAAPTSQQPTSGWVIAGGIGAVALTFFMFGPKKETQAIAPPVAAAAESAPLAIPVPYGAGTNLADISGRWHGEYWGPAAARTTFAVDVSGVGAFRGSILESNTFVIGGGDTLRADIEGNASEGGAIAFRKTYDGSYGVSHSVDYQGQVDSSGTVITGTWVAGENAGEFRMERR